MGLRFSSKVNSTFYHNVLLEAAAASGGKFDVFTHDTMPRRYHFAGNERIAPIYVVPKVGYALTDRVENGTGMSKGVCPSHTCPFSHNSLCRRITDTTTRKRRCMQCLLRTDPSRLSSKRSSRVTVVTSSNVSCPGRTKDGTRRRMIPISWKHFRTWRSTTS